MQTIESSKNPSPYWFYEASLLIEVGKEKSFKELWVADCPYEVQVSRLMNRDSIDRELAIKMIAGQMPSTEKKKAATLVIDTNKSIEELTKQLQEITLTYK